MWWNQIVVFYLRMSSWSGGTEFWSKIAGSLSSRHRLSAAGIHQLYLHLPSPTAQVCLSHWLAAGQIGIWSALLTNPVFHNRPSLVYWECMPLNLKLHHRTILPRHLQINRSWFSVLTPSFPSAMASAGLLSSRFTKAAPGPQGTSAKAGPGARRRRQQGEILMWQCQSGKGFEECIVFREAEKKNHCLRQCRNKCFLCKNNYQNIDL